MTASQAAMIELLDQIIKWSLTVMAPVLIACIVQYTVYQPWWKDPIGRMIVLLEVATLIFVAPLLASLWFHLSGGASIVLGWILIVGSILTTASLIGRFFTWRKEYRQFRKSSAGNSPTPEP